MPKDLTLGVLLGITGVLSWGLVTVLDLRIRARTIARWLGSGSRSKQLPLAGWAGRALDMKLWVRRRKVGARKALRPPRGRDLALIIAEVAARLDAGSPLAEAWRRTWNRWNGFPRLTDLDEDGVPRVIADLAERPDIRYVTGLREVIEVLTSGSVAASARRRACRAIVAACRFTSVLGSPVAQVLDVIADGVDESEAAEDARRIAGAGPRASARVLTAMPLIGVVVAGAMGADPLHRFMDGGVGSACGIVGVVCLISGHVVSRRMLAKLRSIDEAVDPAIMADLAIAGLESGASIPAVCHGLGVAIGDPELSRIGRELRLGAPWDRAWQECPNNAQIIAHSLEAAWVDGMSPVGLLGRAAAQLRSRRVADAQSQAEELGVKLVAPLGILLLPAFVALGLGPILIHMAAQGFGGLG